MAKKTVKKKSAKKSSKKKPAKKKTGNKKTRALKGLTATEIKDQVGFWKRFKVMIQSGVSLIAAMDLAAAECSGTKLRNTIIAIRDEIQCGERMSDCMEERPAVFPPIVTHLFRVGEISGRLETITDRIADLLEGGYVTGKTYPIPDVSPETKKQKDMINIVDLVNKIFLEAVRTGIKAIKVETKEDEVEFKFKKNKKYVSITKVPRKLSAAIVSRYKILSGLDIAERRMPQKGKLQLKIDEKQYDFTVKTKITAHGENVIVSIH